MLTFKDLGQQQMFMALDVFQSFCSVFIHTAQCLYFQKAGQRLCSVVIGFIFGTKCKQNYFEFAISERFNQQATWHVSLSIPVISAACEQFRLYLQPTWRSLPLVTSPEYLAFVICRLNGKVSGFFHLELSYQNMWPCWTNVRDVCVVMFCLSM